MEELNVADFGAIGNGAYDDNASAFQTAIDSMVEMSGDPFQSSEGCELVVPPGRYMMTSKVVINRTVRIRAYGGGGVYQAAKLDWSGAPPSDCGIVIPMASGPAPWAAWGTGTIIEGLALLGPGKGTGPVLTPSCGDDMRAQGHGVLMETLGHLKNCRIENFPGCGIVIAGNTNAHGTASASGWSVEESWVEGCGSHGIYTNCADSNVGYCRASFTGCSGYGVKEHSQHGNKYEACHVRSNALGGYYTADLVGGLNASVFDGCYSEDDQINYFANTTVVTGGLMTHTFGGNRIGVSGGSAMVLEAAYNDDAPALRVVSRSTNTKPLVSVENGPANQNIFRITPDGNVRIGRDPGSPGDDALGSTIDDFVVAYNSDTPTVGGGMRLVCNGWWAGQLRYSHHGGARHHGRLTIETPSDPYGTEKPAMIFERGTARFPPYANEAAIAAIPEPVAGMCVWNVEDADIWVYRTSWSPL